MVQFSVFLVLLLISLSYSPFLFPSFHPPLSVFPHFPILIPFVSPSLSFYPVPLFSILPFFIPYFHHLPPILCSRFFLHFSSVSLSPPPLPPPNFPLSPSLHPSLLPSLPSFFFSHVFPNLMQDQNYNSPSYNIGKPLTAGAEILWKR